MMLSLISAMDMNRNIGLNGDMPWGKEMKADLKHFKHMTQDSIVIMGRKTYESIGGFLPERENLILSTTIPWAFNSVEDILHYVEQRKKDAFVIGGATLYEQFMPHADRIHLTKVHAHLEGDTKFPGITGKWKTYYGALLHLHGDKYSSQYITFERA